VFLTTEIIYFRFLLRLATARVTLKMSWGAQVEGTSSSNLVSNSGRSSRAPPDVVASHGGGGVHVPVGVERQGCVLQWAASSGLATFSVVIFT
jgi:hypothetical protein